jgi:hypothetical protein
MKFPKAMKMSKLLRHALGSFQACLNFQIWDKPDVLERFQNQFWKLESKLKKPRVLWLSKVPCCLFLKPLKEGIFIAFGRFIKDYLRAVTCWEKTKYGVVINSWKPMKKSWFYLAEKNVLGSVIVQLKIKMNSGYKSFFAAAHCCLEKGVQKVENKGYLIRMKIKSLNCL